MGSVALSARRILPLYVYFSTFSKPEREVVGLQHYYIHSLIASPPSSPLPPIVKRGRKCAACVYMQEL